jgi:hypothetical protein
MYPSGLHTVSLLDAATRRVASPRPDRINVESRTADMNAARSFWQGMHISEFSPLVECNDLAIDHGLIRHGGERLDRRVLVHGELTGSSGYRSLVQASTVPPPPVRIETSW